MTREEMLSGYISTIDMIHNFEEKIEQLGSSQSDQLNRRIWEQNIESLRKLKDVLHQAAWDVYDYDESRG